MDIMIIIWWFFFCGRDQLLVYYNLAFGFIGLFFLLFSLIGRGICL